MKKIEIMGCGYIGLPTAITFTLAGYEVCGFDVKDSVVETLNAYEMPTTVKVLVLENAILRYNIALQKQQIEAEEEPPAQVDPADDPPAQAEESEQEADNA